LLEILCPKAAFPFAYIIGARAGAGADLRGYGMSPHPQIDWSQVSKRLAIIAALLCKCLPSVFDGISAEDIASEVVLEFFESPKQLGWDGENDIVAFLGGVLKHRFLDHLRRHGRAIKTRERCERVQPPGFDAIIECDSMLGALDRLVGQDNALKNFLQAVASDEFSCDHNQNQELATILKCRPADVVNVRRRLLRLLKSQVQELNI
jgi:DNA-directed RNA polymerase specialized sigma24 family protein